MSLSACGIRIRGCRGYPDTGLGATRGFLQEGEEDEMMAELALYTIVRQRKWGSSYRSYIVKTETNYKPHSWAKFAYAERRTALVFMDTKLACDYLISHCWNEYYNFDVIELPKTFKRYSVIPQDVASCFFYVRIESRKIA